MEKDSKIYIAGHQGMVGSAIRRALESRGYRNITGKAVGELDLTDQQATARFFAGEKPEYVVLAAAKVGGILANNLYRAQFIYENLMIEANVIHQSYIHGVKKLLFLGSSCIYPKEAPQPLREEHLLTGPLEQTNEPYAIAKIAGIKLCESYYRQYGCNFISVMPTNLYGPNDNYDLEKSHVLPAIIRKMHLARCLETGDWTGIRADLDRLPVEGVTGSSPTDVILEKLRKYGISADPDQPTRIRLTLWGTGRVYREFLHVDDMAAACVKVLEDVEAPDLAAVHAKRQNEPGVAMTAFLNIGTGTDQTILEIAGLVRQIVGFTGQLAWDSSKPDGTFKKLLDVGTLKALGWEPRHSLEIGIRRVYEQYCRDNAGIIPSDTSKTN